MNALPSIETASVAAAQTRPGRLFRKYLLLILSLVSLALLASGGVSMYFTYQETRAALGELQHEKAVAAASRIEQYIHQIEQQLAYAALPQLDPSDIESRRVEFLKLLRQAPEVTDIAQIGADGREQLLVSRLGMDSINSGKDRSTEPAFVNARKGQTWFGAVYFRKETEPYMTIAVRTGSDKGPVTVADVNLKFIWDVVSRIRIGEKGKAYVVDQDGFLIADPDIGLVLRKTPMKQLTHVQAANDPRNADMLAMVSKDLNGNDVLTSFARIDSLHWVVFAEQPLSESDARVEASMLRTALLLIAGLVLSAVGALGLARGMVRPIRVLEEGAQRIGAGQLDHRIEIHTGDELEALAGQFNRMTGQLHESYSGLERKVEERTQELKQSLEQQTAISEILRVISSSPTHVQPVLDAVAERAALLCEAPYARILLVEGNTLRPVTDYAVDGKALPPPSNPIVLSRTTVTGRSVIDRQTVHLPDVVPLLDGDFPGSRESNLKLGSRTVLSVPLVREGGAYGAIFLFRREVRLFSPDQVALVETFARQAAIAIDNVRLFNQTKEALDQQTAISEILRVISSSPTDVQPVLNTVAERAAILCEAPFARILLVDGIVIRPVASHVDAAARSAEDSLPTMPVPLDHDSLSGRAVLERRTIAFDDVVPALDHDFPASRTNMGRFGLRAVLTVPLMREGGAYGTIFLARREPRAFTPEQIALVETFARQAAIAIDNVRLFNQTKEALEQQTAISEILRTLSSSPTDVRPVLDAIAERAARLCDAASASMFLIEGDHLRHLASMGPDTEQVSHVEALPIDRDSLSGRALLERRTIQIADMQAAEGADYPRSIELARRMHHRSVVVMPLFREQQPIGTILLRRNVVKPFTDAELSLLRTFGDQTAIALENVRLFNETKEALEQQQASGEVLSAISSSISDTTPVFDKILDRCERLFAGKVAGINLVGDDGLLHQSAFHGPNREELERIFPLPIDESSGSGKAIFTRSLVHYPDTAAAEVPEATRRACAAVGYRAVIFAPLLWEDRGIGVVFVGRDFSGPFSDKEIALLRTFADQAVIAIQNARLFNEIQDKSRQLEIANKHKSEFLANMSHELRTPLNAIIGFSEVLLERLFGELNPKQDDYLKDIHSSGRHLLQLINDILDLSKVEAGRMDLELSSFDLPTAIANALTLVRERAQKHGIALGQEVEATLGEITADERKFKQILLNLLSNAVKFTPDGGRVDVRARRDGDWIAVSVADTGIGIAPEDQAAVFEEFRQVGPSYTSKQEGTGLGLALTKRFVELHGGSISLASESGKGSVFTFTIPARAKS